MKPGWIVPGLDEAEGRHARLGVGGEPAPREQLAFEDGKEALAQGVVIGITDGSHGWPDTGLPAAFVERQGRILGGLKWSSQHRMGRRVRWRVGDVRNGRYGVS